MGTYYPGRQSCNPCLAPETHLHKSLGRKTTTTRWRQTAVDPGKGWKGRKTPSWHFSLDIYFYNLTITQHLMGLGNWTFWTHSQSHMVEFCCIIHTPREIVLCVEFSSKLYLLGHCRPDGFAATKSGLWNRSLRYPGPWEYREDFLKEKKKKKRKDLTGRYPLCSGI